MKMFLRSIAIGVSALIASISSPAEAQLAPGAQVHPGAGHSVPSGLPQTPTIGRSLEDRILVRGDMEAVNNRRLPPEAAGYMQNQQAHTEVTRREWNSRGWSEATFDRIRSSNYALCVNTTVYILRLEDLAERYRGRIPMVQQLADRYMQLGGNIRSASRIRSATNLLTPILGFVAGGPAYAGITALGAIGNEAQGQAHDRAALLNRDSGVLYTQVMMDHIEFSLLATDMYKDYLGMVSGYCNEFLSGSRQQQPSSFTGYGPQATTVTHSPDRR